MILLDTCTLLWLTLDQEGLSEAAKKMMQANPDRLAVSAVSAWEIGIKYHKKNLELPLPAALWYCRVLEHHEIQELPITGLVAVRSTELPHHHQDPADRLLISTALFYRCPILTPDLLFKRYEGITVLW